VRTFLEIMGFRNPRALVKPLLWTALFVGFVISAAAQPALRRDVLFRIFDVLVPVALFDGARKSWQAQRTQPWSLNKHDDRV
jgi:hypothetical protein